jgi:hypothetical protein
MTNRPDLIREVEDALTRAPVKGKSWRYAVYVPRLMVIGTYKEMAKARDVAASWTAVQPDVVVVDRGCDAESRP